MTSDDERESSRPSVSSPDSSDVRPAGSQPPKMRPGRQLDIPVCACGCGERFFRTDPRQEYVNPAHRKRALRRRAKTGMPIEDSKSGRPKDEEDELIEIERHAIAAWVRRGEAFECVRCHGIFVPSKTSDPNYCGMCSIYGDPEGNA